MAKISLAKWKEENPLGTFEDWKKAAEKAGQKVSELDKRLFDIKKNIERSTDSGTINDKGDKSIVGNPGAKIIENELNKLKMKLATDENKAKVLEFQSKVKERLEDLQGKNEEEQKKAVSDLLPKTETVKTFSPAPKTEIMPLNEPEKKGNEKTERQNEIDNKSDSFIKAWASTHPSWAKILKSKDLSFGQKVQLIGSALANMGANVTLGMKSGFEHSGFQPIEWDYKKGMDKYFNQEVESVLGAEQNARAKFNAGEWIKKYKEIHGEEATDDIIAMIDLYGDNPTVLKNRLEAQGINLKAEELKALYAEAEKTNVSESTKQKILDTTAKQLANRIQELQAKVTGATADKLIEAQNALNNFNNIKYSSDGKTYNLEKAGRYLKNIISTVEDVASTAGGIASGGLVGKVHDGIIKADGTPQKIVKADGTEIELSPYDNIYATENPLTTEKDNGEKIVPMAKDDEVITIQKKLGYGGGFINKDFDYYLNKLRG